MQPCKIDKIPYYLQASVHYKETLASRKRMWPVAKRIIQSDYNKNFYSN